MGFQQKTMQIDEAERSTTSTKSFTYEGTVVEVAVSAGIPKIVTSEL